MMGTGADKRVGTGENEESGVSETTLTHVGGTAEGAKEWWTLSPHPHGHRTPGADGPLPRCRGHTYTSGNSDSRGWGSAEDLTCLLRLYVA